MFWIEGWVEATRVEPAEPGQDAWEGVIRLAPLVDVADVVSERLFGLSKKTISSGNLDGALAPRRGVPPNPSPQVRGEIDDIAAHEAQFGAGEYGGYTYAEWTEIAPLMSSEFPPRTSDWTAVFEMIKLIAADPRFAAGRVRIVVWYNW